MGKEVGVIADWLQALARHPLILVMLGGAIGTAARYGISRWLGAYPWAQTFPFATLVINVSGSFILGLTVVLIRERLPIEYHDWYFLIGTGFCGGYTTFSTFEWETFQLIRDGSWWLALSNVGGSVLAGFFGVVIAVVLAGAILPRQ